MQLCGLDWRLAVIAPVEGEAGEGLEVTKVGLIAGLS